MAHSMSPDKVKRKQVSLGPINTFLSGSKHGLIMGDDPGNESRQNSFTVAPIDYEGTRQGYIYAILGSDKIGHITEVLQRSLIMKWSASAVFTALGICIHRRTDSVLLFDAQATRTKPVNATVQEQ